MTSNTVMWKEIHQQPDVLKRTYAQNIDTIRALVAELNEKKPHTVVFGGRGTSDHACQYAKYLLEIYKGLPCALTSPSVITVYGGTYHLENTVVIAASQSGMAADVLEIIRAGNASGAITVSITNNADSPLAKEAKYHLNCFAEKECALAATKTFTAQLYILLTLAAEWSGNAQLLELVKKVPDMAEKAIGMADEIEAIVPRYRFMTDCFVLARGVNLPLAFEISLKLAETSYTRARGYAISDFHHGPFAMVDRHTPVFVIAADQKEYKDASDITTKLENAGADILSITTDEALAARGSCALRLPQDFTNEAAIFPIIILMQMFACRLTEVKGQNPDAPRGLNKVTITK